MCVSWIVYKRYQSGERDGSIDSMVGGSNPDETKILNGDLFKVDKP